jgi:hypothetical protein
MVDYVGSADTDLCSYVYAPFGKEPSELLGFVLFCSNRDIYAIR